MTTDRRMRASDQDRENAVESLCGAYAEGRLRPGEFYERIDAAYAALTWGKLESLTADLPPAQGRRRPARGHRCHGAAFCSPPQSGCS